MWSSALFVLSALALVSHVSATSFVPRTIPQLLARQTAFDPSIIPPACNTDCTITVSSIKTCVPPQPADCGCTPNEEKGLITCLNCILGVGAPTSAIIEQVQSFVDQYVILCNRAGVALPATTVKGGVSLVTSTAPPVSSGRSQATTRSSATISGASSATITILGPSGDDDDDFFTTSQPRAARSTVTPSQTDSPGPFENVPNDGNSVKRSEVWVAAAAAAGIALVVFF